jgi:hypothetical protein
VRLAIVWLVLVGLAVMHVLPGGQACPETRAGHPSAAGVMKPLDRRQMVTDRHRAAAPDLLVAAAGSTGGMSGTLCSATPPSRGLGALVGLLAGGLVAAVAASIVPWLLPAAKLTSRRRGPPRAGPALLHDLGVSRT